MSFEFLGKEMVGGAGHCNAFLEICSDSRVRIYIGIDGHVIAAADACVDEEIIDRRTERKKIKLTECIFFFFSLHSSLLWPHSYYI